MQEKKWAGAALHKWSGERFEEKWIPNSVQKHMIHKYSDSTSSEITSIYFVFHKSTGEIYRINNDGTVSDKHIIIRLRCENYLAPNWTREYVISPDKDGEDVKTIDVLVNVRDFLLIKEQGKWKFADNVAMTVKVEDI